MFLHEKNRLGIAFSQRHLQSNRLQRYGLAISRCITRATLLAVHKTVICVYSMHSSPLHTLNNVPI